ncbi:MAG: MiaB/RimO family radical SAM methylthiotransferase [Acetatifactor sp.]
MKTVAFHNLGCKVNSYELEVMQQKLQDKGYLIVPFDSVADIYIINTCTVTNMADRKSRQMLHRAKQRNPQAVVVAAGCYVQSGGKSAEQDESIDLLVGNNRKKDIVEILEDYLRRRAEQTGTPDKTLGGTTVTDINHTYEYEEMQLRHTSEHTRAYIKIQDGCNQFCSYCEIPYARGRVRSRRAEDILTEIGALAGAGYKEVVLTGIHISSYGIDFDGQAWAEGRSVRSEGKEHPEYTGDSKLIDLVERIQGIPGLERIRLGSLEPRIVTPETAERLAAVKGLCPHFHLSLQSGCDETLKRMNRHYTTGEYLTAVELLRKAFVNPAITTDVIVGFPGETEEEFGETRAFLEKVGFYEMHIFKYSRRAGTAADKMPNQLPEQVKTARSNELLAMEKRQSAEFRRAYIGREAEVLLEDTEEIQGELWRIGHTPDYVRVAVKPEGTVENTIVKVPVQGFLTEEILVSLEF